MDRKSGNQLTAVEVLRALPELALGLVAAAFLPAVFLGAAVLVVFVTVFLGPVLAGALYHN